MPLKPIASVENNFTQGLKTEFTGLNFPENAATDTDNCIYTLVGEVTRRPGFDFETNGTSYAIDRTGKAVSSYKWNNAGGDGLTEVLVTQVGGTLYFFRSSTATTASPLSGQKLAATITLSSHLVSGSSYDPSLVECQYADGNGYLFVFHPHLEPFYCVYNAGTITATAITVQIRDVLGIPEVGVADNFRSASLGSPHHYNLLNQGWTDGTVVTFTDTTTTVGVNSGRQTFSGVQTGQTIAIGTYVDIEQGTIAGGLSKYGNQSSNSKTVMSGSVVSYSGSTLIIYVDTINTTYAGLSYVGGWTIKTTNAGYIDDWVTQLGVYPSNSDVWWVYKDPDDKFSPSKTYSIKSNETGPAPKGHYILTAFSQGRLTASGQAVTDVISYLRPKTGCWYQGRIWYTGIDDSIQASGTAPYTTFSESIYFSQITLDQNKFGCCYQVNDPTSEGLFGLLPTDGGVITIPGSGSIYRLIPNQNGLFVFAANGIWFIAGSQGTGFSATDFAVSKISTVQTISSTSFVIAEGVIFFWNEEGIYSLSTTSDNSGQAPLGSTHGGIRVEPLTVGTILSFYRDIPKLSKKYVRGDYDPINYEIKWIFRSEIETNITTRYSFNRILTFNTVNKAFYPYTISSTPTSAFISDIRYISHPGGSTAPDPGFKYLTSKIISAVAYLTFSEEFDDTHYVDWHSYNGVGIDYTSYFVTGYKLHGQGQRKTSVEYIYIYSNNDTDTAYRLQSIWDYGSTRNSNKWSAIQLFTNVVDNFSKVFRRHRTRGHGYILQFKISSVSGSPFNIQGWSVLEQLNSEV